MEKKQEERCCGNCCWFKHENADGWGTCYVTPLNDFCNCEMRAEKCFRYVSNEQMRHHMAVLLQANRYRRDQHVPAIYKMPNPKELGEAIDFAVGYMKTFERL